MHLHVLYMELQGGRWIKEKLRRVKEFLLKQCGIFHQSHALKECFNPQKSQKISYGMHKVKNLMGKCVIHQTLSWKVINHSWLDFATDSSNLRLSISTNGINPHSSLSSRHSYWVTIMITYNLPSLLSMKRKFMVLYLLILGPWQADNDIDIYLAPLIEDLKTLWEVGVEAYDAYKKEVFTWRVVLLWTINDFPAYGNLFGCTIKGYFSCPICGRRLIHIGWSIGQRTHL